MFELTYLGLNKARRWVDVDVSTVTQITNLPHEVDHSF